MSSKPRNPAYDTLQFWWARALRYETRLRDIRHRLRESNPRLIELELIQLITDTLDKNSDVT